MQRAKALMAGLRWHHLGFAFFWATTFAALTNASEGLAPGYEAYAWCKQATVVITLIVLAAVLRRREHYTHAHAIAAGVLLATGSLLFFLAFFFGQYSLAAVLTAGVAVGCASGGFFAMWQSFYASEGASRTAICIPLSAACSVVLCLVVSALPAIWSVVCSVIVLPSAATICLCRSLDEIEPYDVRPLANGRAAMLLRDMAKPVFCVSAIGFVWRLVGGLYKTGDGQAFLVLMAGMACATLAVTAVELFSDRGFDVLACYRLLFPVVTGMFLLPTLFGPAWLPVLSGCLMFGFEAVNLLLIMTCAVYASRNAMNATVVYAICLGPTLFALLCGDAAGAAINRGMLYDFTFVVDVLFVCIYGLSLVMFCVSVGRNRRKASRIAVRIVPGQGGAQRIGAPSCESSRISPPAQGGRATECEGDGRRDSQARCGAADCDEGAARQEVASRASLEARLDGLDTAERLSRRECDVAELLLHGNTVAAIARKLYISENTVRGHMKSIYRKLGVHSKQELIDLLG